MKIIKQSCEWVQPPPADVLQIIEACARTCYKSEANITPDSAAGFVKRLAGSIHQPYVEHLQNSHLSVIEHVSASVRFVTDRGVTHEMVRHRVASYSQESTRYCNYCKDKFGGEVTFILPVRFQPYFIRQVDVAAGEPECVEYTDEMPSALGHRLQSWMIGMKNAERSYLEDLKDGATAQEARDFLPNSLKTEIVTTYNLREWRHFFLLRCSHKAHPQMQDLARQALRMFHKAVPVLFDELAAHYLKEDADNG